MPQVHFSLDDESIARLAREAEARGLSLSRYIATLVAREAPSEWPNGYLDRVVGAFADAPLEEPSDLPLDEPDVSV